jgi:hypothetical protein
VEHFVTLFDQGFLAMGLALHGSLRAQAGPSNFRLWIVCMDDEVETSLKALDLPDVSLIPLREIETPGLLAVKPGRSRGEYCWTVTPFTFPAVFERAPEAKQVTYLDADLYFFAPPNALLDEFARSGKDVLITDHAYAPEYDMSVKSGRFCVQFLTFRNTAAGMEVLRSWQAQCLEWCFARFEPNRFGDQKYLDEWPEKYARAVHILAQTDKTLAPWNASMFESRAALAPVFYHFHGLRLVREREVLCCVGYRISAPVRKLYETYVKNMAAVVNGLEQRGIRVPRLPRRRDLGQFLYDLRDTLRGRNYWSRI